LLSERLVEYPYDQPEAQEWQQEPCVAGALHQKSTAPPAAVRCERRRDGGDLAGFLCYHLWPRALFLSNSREIDKAQRVTRKTVTAGTRDSATVVHEHTIADHTGERYRGWPGAPGASLQQAKFNRIAQH
jgi:hypothetical protein